MPAAIATVRILCELLDSLGKKLFTATNMTPERHTNGASGGPTEIVTLLACSLQHHPQKDIVEVI